MGRQRVVAPS